MSSTKTEDITTKERRVREFSRLGFGIVLHWGLYSLSGRGEWTLHAHGLDRDEYESRIKEFTAEGFDARAIARAAKEAGAGYIIFTTRHHDGFSLYDSGELNDFDSLHAPAGRDLTKEFVEACREEELLPILYHTTMDWRWKGKTTWELSEDEFKVYLDYLYRSVEILCTRYGRIGGLIFDGNWCRPESDWNYDRLYSMIRRHQPDALIMDNTGLERPGALDHPEIDAVTFEQHGLSEGCYGERIAALRWLTLNSHWGWSNLDFNFKSGREILEGLVESRRYGAVYTLNLGPKGDGSLDEMDRAVLKRIGAWMKLYGEAIREGRPAGYDCSGRDFILNAPDGEAWYVCLDLEIAGHENVTESSGSASLRRVAGWDRPVRSVRWMDNDENLGYELSGGDLEIRCTGYPYGEQHVIRIARIESD